VAQLFSQRLFRSLHLPSVLQTLDLAQCLSRVGRQYPPLSAQPPASAHTPEALQSSSLPGPQRQPSWSMPSSFGGSGVQYPSEGHHVCITQSMPCGMQAPSLAVQWACCRQFSERWQSAVDRTRQAPRSNTQAPRLLHPSLRAQSALLVRAHWFARTLQ